MNPSRPATHARRFDIDWLRGVPAWAGSLAAAHTIPRELRVSDVFGANPEALKAIQAPALFLIGRDSPASFRTTTETLHGYLSNQPIRLPPGQARSAMLKTAGLFAQEVTPFLRR